MEILRNLERRIYDGIVGFVVNPVTEMAAGAGLTLSPSVGNILYRVFVDKIPYNEIFKIPAHQYTGDPWLDFVIEASTLSIGYGLLWSGGLRWVEKRQTMRLASEACYQENKENNSTSPNAGTL